jgi:hypothetical protein
MLVDVPWVMDLVYKVDMVEYCDVRWDQAEGRPVSHGLRVCVVVEDVWPELMRVRTGEDGQPVEDLFFWQRDAWWPIIGSAPGTAPYYKTYAEAKEVRISFGEEMQWNPPWLEKTV